MADFTQALKIVQLGLEQWREKPHNSKWWKLIDGTPIPNDLCVVIAETLVTSNSIAEASTYSRGYQDAIEEMGLPARPGVTQADMDCDDLRCDAENLHKLFDRLGAPQSSEDGPLSLYGRFEALPQHAARPVPAGALDVVAKVRDFDDACGGVPGAGGYVVFSKGHDEAAALVEAHVDLRVAEMRALIAEAATALEPFGNAFNFPEDEGWSDTDKIECFIQRDERDKDGLWLLFVLGVPAFRAAAATLGKLRAKDGSDA